MVASQFMNDLCFAQGFYLRFCGFIIGLRCQGYAPLCLLECVAPTKIIGLRPICARSKEIVQGAVLVTLSSAEKTLSHPKHRKALRGW